MAYDARQIANWFLKRAQKDGRSLSIMSLLKLVYIAHGWHLEIYDKPLISNRIEAWKYGPVIPQLYFSLRPKGIVPSDPIEGFDFQGDERTIELLEQVYKNYGRLSAISLSNLTHESGGPWEIASRLGGYYAPIPDDLIKSHYVLKRREAEQRGAKAHRD